MSKQPPMIRTRGWFVEPLRTRVVFDDYTQGEPNLVRMGLEEYWTLDKAHLPWKPITVFSVLTPQWATDKTVPGVGDWVWLIGHPRRLWLVPDEHVAAKIDAHFKQELYALHREFSRASSGPRFKDTTREAQREAVQRALAHLESLADVGTIIQRLKALQRRFGPHAYHGLRRLLDWLQARMLALDHWLDTQATRAYEFMLADKLRNAFTTSASYSVTDHTFKRLVVNPKALTLPFYMDKWFQSMQKHAAFRRDHQLPLRTTDRVSATNWHEGLQTTYEQLGVLRKE